MVSVNNRRRDKDVMKILVSGYKVELPDENRMSEIIVDFPGPVDSPYAGVSIKLSIILHASNFKFIADREYGKCESSYLTSIQSSHHRSAF